VVGKHNQNFSESKMLPGGTGKAAHQPVVYAVRVVGMHTGQVANLVTDHELDHTDDASENTRDVIKTDRGNSITISGYKNIPILIVKKILLSVFLAAIVRSCRKMLNQPHPLGYLNLF
jgi:hypothetical protein